MTKKTKSQVEKRLAELEALGQSILQKLEHQSPTATEYLKIVEADMTSVCIQLADHRKLTYYT